MVGEGGGAGAPQVSLAGGELYRQPRPLQLAGKGRMGFVTRESGAESSYFAKICKIGAQPST